MLLDIRKISQEKQIEKYGCVAACISMVTGISQKAIINEIEKDGYEMPFNQEAADRFLTRHDVHSAKLSHGMFVEGMIYLITCASPISPASAHMIVGYVYDGYMRILDPADDLENEKLYSSTDFSENMVPCFEYYLLTDCRLEAH